MYIVDRKRTELNHFRVGKSSFGKSGRVGLSRVPSDLTSSLDGPDECLLLCLVVEGNLAVPNVSLFERAGGDPVTREGSAVVACLARLTSSRARGSGRSNIVESGSLLPKKSLNEPFECEGATRPAPTLDESTLRGPSVAGSPFNFPLLQVSYYVAPRQWM